MVLNQGYKKDEAWTVLSPKDLAPLAGQCPQGKLVMLVVLNSGVWSPLCWRFRYSTALSKQTCFLWKVWAVFQDTQNSRQTVWKPQTWVHSYLSSVHTSLSCLFLLADCVLSGFESFYNLYGFCCCCFRLHLGLPSLQLGIYWDKSSQHEEKHAFNYKTWEFLVFMQNHWTLFLASLLTCVYLVWSALVLVEAEWWCCP